jgi:hypothetical protein
VRVAPAKLGKIRTPWEYMRSLPPLDRLLRQQLVRLCIILIRVMGRLRFNELEFLGKEATEPDAEDWCFETTSKLHEDSEIVLVPRLRQLALDPVRHILEV